MHKLQNWLDWWLGKPQPASDPLGEALQAFQQDDAESTQLLRQLVAVIRPRHRSDGEFVGRLRAMLDRLTVEDALRRCFQAKLGDFVVKHRLTTFFTDSGMLPGTGFFSEGWRILGERLLPAEPDLRKLRDCLHLIFDQHDDWRWLEAVPDTLRTRFWQLLTADSGINPAVKNVIESQMIDAVVLLAHRISGLGVDAEIMRADPDFDAHTPRFIALSAEAVKLAECLRQPACTADGAQLLVIADQCRDTLARIRKRARQSGTSLHLSYLLAQGDQALQRLEALLAILLPAPSEDLAPRHRAHCADFVHNAVLAENRRNSLGPYLTELSQMLAVRVTENAARSGEHYICSTQEEYEGMWRSAAGAGLLIGAMALLKIFAGGLHAPLAVEAIMYSLIYGLGFVAIYLLGLTVATKQPAMTAQTLAGMLDELRPTRQADVEKVVDVVAAVSRSQLAAIAGNVLLALPTAIVIGWAWGYFSGQIVLGEAKAAKLLADLDPLSWALPHAALAGFYLYLSGLLTGYFENHAAYAAIGPRLARLPWLNRLIGPARARRLGLYIEAHLGGIMGNFLFGCMLGSTGVIGTILGLPVDIRHIAFSAANLGYALIGSHFALAWPTLAWAVLGVILIGATNLLVSFTLALRTALSARRVKSGDWGTVFGALGRRIRSQPRSFILPQPKRSG